MSTLEATISGDVTDGNWFSMGDGVFLPSSASSSQFSITTHYIPGANDQSNGSVNLLLVSDDPDGIGPQIEVSDMVTLYFQSAPALVCNNNINVTLDVNCQQEVTIDMLIPNPEQPSNRYTIQLQDENGDVIPDNILTGDYIGQNVTFIVGHECAQITCSGMLSVADNFAPVFQCANVNVSCTQGSDPDDVGLPIPNTATATYIGDNTYEVSGWDACGTVTLTYSDSNTEPGCGTPLDRIVNRTWVAEDQNGNTSICAQPILVERISIDDVVFPMHLDNNEAEALSCTDTYATDENGHPATSVSGTPMPNTCNHLDYSYSDTEHDICGGGVKILRAWQAVDWCTAETRNMNQIIKIEDDQAPILSCPQDMTASTDPYDCASSWITLPDPVSVVDCSNYTLSASIQLENNAGSMEAVQMQFNDIPVGVHNVTYTATDECGQSSECSFLLTVIDDVVPHVSCDEFTTASITSDGAVRVYASTFDDNSTDNCGIVSYQVAKMTDQCGHGLALGDYVDFCCSEVGSSIMVRLVVTDAAGNSNTCMVNVTIDDKIAPEITCPSDITIACDTHYDLDDLSQFGTVRNSQSAVEDITFYDDVNNGVVGQDGWASDNCGFDITETATDNVSCYEGQIVRTFTVTDQFGLTNTCTQRITIVNPDPIEENDIHWPANIEVTGCKEIETDTSMTGAPYTTGVDCGNLGLEYSDEVFPFSDSACVKILRTWTAIDWCQYDSDTNAGLWSDTQVIKLSNIIAPEIHNCADTLVCTYDDECSSGRYEFALIATDDCNDSLSLQYTWKIDLDQDGTIDMSGTGNELDRVLPIGSHQIQWEVADACGNSTNCDYEVVVKDCKAPTPYCFSSITTALMPTTGEIAIWADDFDFGSYDNCTSQDDLIFSFGPDVNQTSLSFNCDSIENGFVQYVSLDMYVTDAFGNQDYCTVELVLYDNDDVCPNHSPDGTIKGGLRTATGKKINGANVRYEAYEQIVVDSTLSNEQGRYVTDPTYDQVPYNVSVKKMDEVDEGVTSIDLVLIQRHILGFAEFQDPLQVIASDINGSNSVSSSDIVALRKLVLGITNTLPGNAEPWRFIPKGWVFQDTLAPWDFDKYINITPLDGTALDVDFTAVKVGDVNDSYESLSSNEEAENRSSWTTEIIETTSYTENGKVITYTLAEDMLLDAFEMSLEINTDNIAIYNADDQAWSDNMYNLADGKLRIIGTHLAPQLTHAGEVLFSLVVDEDAEVVPARITKNLIYQDAMPYEMVLRSYNENDEVIKEDNNWSLIQNPARYCRIASKSELQDTRVRVIDISGREVFASSIHGLANKSYVEIPVESFEQSGMYFIHIVSSGVEQTLRYVHLK